MQIKSLIFYNSTGEKRILSFNIGKVNIITGESKTGKTALIDIVNYCLGSDDCKISEGVIRDTVEWFAIHLHFKNEEVFIARQNPNRLHQNSTNHIHFENGDRIAIPDMKSLQSNSDIATLKAFFTRKLFISEYTNIPESGTRYPLAVNFKHSRFYCFQPQDLIAQRNYLFYNQSDNFVAQSIRDTLPYFLGAVREDAFLVEQEIIVKKRELHRLERDLKEYERLKQDGSKKLFQLANEAKQLNLIAVERPSSTSAEAFQALKEVLRWEETFDEVIQGENENLKKLIEEKLGFERQLSRKRDDLKAVKEFMSDSADYSSEAGQQKARLESINLYNHTDANLHACPLCNQDIQTQIPSIEAINKSLTDLSENLTTTLAERPKLTQYVEVLNAEVDQLRKEIEIRQNGIKAIYAEQEEANKQKDFNLRRGKTIGKIALFLESFFATEENESLKSKIESLRTQITTLEEGTGTDEKENKLESILNQINTQMTGWKNSLDLEYKESPIRFDIKKLTIFADTPTRSVPLLNMGSGANWVAYHLLIHFSLHKHFVKANRPVPRFLIIDQPSQIYFPPEKDPNQTGLIELSTDEKAVHQIFDFILAVTRELAPDFQVIITDHAKLNYPDFTEAIIEEWRGGQKLIPDNWLPRDA